VRKRSYRERVERSKSSTLPVGVCKNRLGGFTSGIKKEDKYNHLGTFNTAEEASIAYVLAKEAYVKEVALKWKDKIPKNVFDALMVWTVY